MTEPTDRRVRIEPSEKRVRAYLDGQLVVDASHPFLVWESPRYPTYYFRPDRPSGGARPDWHGPAFAEPRRRGGL